MNRLTLLASLFGAVAQTQAPKVSGPPMLYTVESNLPTQKVGVDDLISVFVVDCPELTRTFRVAANGTLPLPLLKEPINANGKYPIEIEREITVALITEEVLVRPVVSASVVEYRSRPVSVMGAVRYPITFQALGNVTLLDALTQAQGLSPDAGPEILVSRARSEQNGVSTELVQRIPVKGLIDAADPSLNMKLYGGEEIRVPEAGKVYVVGNVKQPGAFAVHDGTETTVLKVLALSEGLLPFAAKQAYIYRRESGTKTQNEIPIELSRIIDRKSPDVSLKANDVLYIPDNKHRRMTMTALDRIVGFGSATASGLVIWQH
ncbi:MAG: SLBB domain-containing protein [Bryobacteraceae bacterium]